MQPTLLTIISILAYIVGLVIVIIVTPRLLKLSYDAGMFMGIAAADVVGGLLAFGAVAITFAVFNGAFATRVLDFLLLLGILIVGWYMAVRSFRPRPIRGTFRISRILAGSYCLLLLFAALYAMIILFVP
jgi:hypothetical protein